jgi:putative ABC transport system permease protein
VLAFLDSVAYEALPYALVGLGIILTYRYLRLIDLTFAASFVVGPAVTGAMLVNNTPFIPALLVGIAVVLCLAAATLALMRFFEIDGLLAGLLSSFGGFAIALLFTQGTLSLHSVRTPFDTLKAIDYPWVDGVLPLHPAQIAIILVLVTAAKFAVDRFLGSELGLAFRAMEDERSRGFLIASAGLSEGRLVAIGVTAGNFLCGVAGVLVMLKEGQITANRGFDAVIVVIAAYLLGHLLFERRPQKARDAHPVAKALTSVALFKPTGATILGLLFYFVLLAAVSRTALPASAPRLLMLAIIVFSFATIRWSDILADRQRAAADYSYLVPSTNPFHVENVNVDYPAYPTPSLVIRNAQIEVAPGSVVHLQGPNGSGKSTLLRYFAGLTPGRGKILVPMEGIHESRLIADRKSVIGYISQEAHLATSAVLTVDENLALFRIGSKASSWRPWTPDTDGRLPAPVSLLFERARGTAAGALSGGQRQLLSLAALMVRPAPPPVILFDEPLTHLDETNAAACLDLIERLSSQGRTLIFVQHDIASPATTALSDSRARLARLITRSIDLAAIQGANRNG